MGDLKDPRLIYLKGWLFLLIGFLAAGGILLEHPEWRTAVLLVLAIWAFCRFYYFAFYVIEKYVDPTFKFSSLFAFGCYLIKRRFTNPDTKAPDEALK
jgi:hypothetical protein